MTRDVWAVVVARTGPSAKTRLATVLDAETRSALAVAMLTDVLRSTRGAGLGGTVAVLDPPRAPTGDVMVVADPGGGLGRAVEAGVDAAVAAGARGVIVLPGDLPLLDEDDVRALAAAAVLPRSVAVATDRHGTGTNALVLRPPTAIAPAFGPGSAARHLEAARAAGVAARRVECERAALDIDTPADLAELLRRGPVGATALVLASLPLYAFPVAGRAIAALRSAATVSRQRWSVRSSSRRRKRIPPSSSA